MNTRHDVSPRRTPRRSPVTALALMALAVAAIAAGCIQGHDPRTDGSRDVPAISRHSQTV